MRNFIVVLFFVCLIAIGISACSSTQATGMSNQVHMDNTTFLTTQITIKKGESVTLVDDVPVEHIIANGIWKNNTPINNAEPGAPQINNIMIPGNGSSTIGPFNTAGTYQIYCTIHLGMNLTVIVQ